jgi:hypothetical protein
VGIIKKCATSGRWWILLVLPLLIIGFHSFGPDGWREPLVKLLWMSWAVLGLTAAHVARRILHPYANAEEAWDRANQSPVGAGLNWLGLCILTAAMFLGFISYARAEVTTYIPERAYEHAPVVTKEIERVWAEMPFRSYVGSLVEQETCITLRHKYCWSPTARLKTSREEGAGLGQITRAWGADGALRFDSLSETKALDPSGLRELTWESVYYRVDLNIRAMLVKLRDCDKRMRQLTVMYTYNRVAMCDAAYNGGMGGMLNDRKLCHLTPKCDPNVWFGHVEHTSGKSRQKWQGYGKSAFEINREHVSMAMIVRRPKYVVLFGQ